MGSPLPKNKIQSLWISEKRGTEVRGSRETSEWVFVYKRMIKAQEHTGVPATPLHFYATPNFSLFFFIVL